MATFAHGNNGFVYDAHVNNDLNDYLLRYNSVAIFTWLGEGHAFKQITDIDTNGDITAEHTAIVDHGDGTYTNPIVFVPTKESEQ